MPTFSTVQLGFALRCLVTAAVPLSSPESPSQRYLVVGCGFKQKEFGIVALARFQMPPAVPSLTVYPQDHPTYSDLSVVVCASTLDIKTKQTSEGLHVTFQDSYHSLEASVGRDQMDACAHLLTEAKRLRKLADAQDLSEHDVRVWAAGQNLTPRHDTDESTASQRSIKASQVNILMNKWRSEFVSHETLNILTATWNVNGHLLSQEDDLTPLLIHAADAHIVTMGFQEMDLSTEALVRYTPNRALAYEEQLRRTLAKFGVFHLVTAKQLVGLYIVVFAREQVRPHISQVSLDSCATGPLGLANKGAVAVSMRVHESTIAFVSAHLTAFEEYQTHRLEDLKSIFSKIHFNPGEGAEISLGLIPKISSNLAHQLPRASLFHSDHLFLIGDLNFRIQLENEVVRKMCANFDFKGMLAKDQLLPELDYGSGDGILKGFREPEIRWSPTYKFDKQSSSYDSSEKSRTPSYTDRILWMSALPSTPKFYQAHFEMGQSDHKPVSAAFDIAVERTDPEQYRKAQLAVLNTIDKAENEQRPTVTASHPVLEFPPLSYNQTVVRDTTVANTGTTTAKWHFMLQENYLLGCKPWVTVEPQAGTLQPGDSTTITVTAHVTLEQTRQLNNGELTMEPDLLVLSVEGGRDIFLTISMLSWNATFLTMPLEALARTPAAVRQMTHDQRLAAFDEDQPELRQLPKELLQLTSFLIQNAIDDPDVFTLPSERHVQKLVIEEIDQGHELDMEELVRSAARIETAEHAHHHSASRDDDDVVDLSDQSNMLSLDENPALEDERQEFESKARRKVAVAVGTVLLEMLDCLPEPVIKRSLHDHVTTADLSDPKLPEPYHILSRLSNPHVAAFTHICAFLKAYCQSSAGPPADTDQEKTMREQSYKRQVELIATAFGNRMIKPKEGTEGSGVARAPARERGFVKAFIQVGA